MAAINTKQIENRRHNRRLTVKIAVYLVLTLLVIGFIFGNSLKTREDSGKISTGIAEILKPFFDPHDSMTADDFHSMIRKFAHGLEFAMLGLCCGGVMWCVAEMSKKYHVAASVLIPLIIAVLDEFIQSFNGRGSDVRDVMIDFGGAVVGLAVISLIETLLSRKRKTKE